MWLILFITCFVAAAYGLYGLGIILLVACSRLWSLLPPDPEIVDRQRRMAADREVVRQGKVPGSGSRVSH